jgi:hypothetical protein
MAEKALTKEELIEKLAAMEGFERTELEKMGKGDLKKTYESATVANDVLDLATPVISATELGTSDVKTDDSVAVIVKDQPAIPLPTDPKWTDYVLGQFEDSELENGNPKVDGLRRVAEKLLGIFSIIPTVIQSPTLESGATVTVLLQFTDGRTVGGSADVSERNTARDYAVHSVATAETRAEGRALRKALRLTKVLAAEELHNADADEPDGTDKRAPTNMVQSLNIMCQRVAVDFAALSKLEFGVDRVEDLTISQARKIAPLLHEYKTGGKEIPDEIRTV